MSLQAARARAASAGLNVQAVVQTRTLAGSIPRLADLADDWPSLLLFGSTGPALWDAVHRSQPDPDDPIDRFVDSVLADVVDALDGRARVLWPDPGARPPFPISLAGRVAGWGSRSRMGLTIHPRHGLWVGYRGAVLLADPAPDDREPATSSPCPACPAPCVTGCPVGAVGGPDGLDVVACFTERLRPGAACNTACLARAACPEGDPRSRYSDAQVAHHQAFANRAFGPAVLAASPSVPAAWKED